MRNDDLEALEHSVPAFAYKIKEKIESLQAIYRQKRFDEMLETGNIICFAGLGYTFPEIITPVKATENLVKTLYEAEADDMNRRGASMNIRLRKTLSLLLCVVLLTSTLYGAMAVSVVTAEPSATAEAIATSVPPSADELDAVGAVEATDTPKPSTTADPDASAAQDPAITAAPDGTVSPTPVTTASPEPTATPMGRKNCGLCPACVYPLTGRAQPRVGSSLSKGAA